MPKLTHKRLEEKRKQSRYWRLREIRRLRGRDAKMVNFTCAKNIDQSEVEEIVDLTTKDVDFRKQIQNLQVEHNMEHLPLFEFARHIVNLQIWYEL